MKHKPESLVIRFWESTCGFSRHKMVDRWHLDFKTVRSLCFLPAHSTWQVNKLNEAIAIQSNLSEPSISKHLLIQILKNQEELKATLKIHSSLLTNMLKNNDSSSEQSFTLPDNLSFPIKTIEKFEEMEIKLGGPSLKKTL